MTTSRTPAMDYTEVYTSDLITEYRDKVIRASIPNTVFFSIVLTVGALGNSFVLYVYTVKMSQNKMESRFFIPVLSFYDLLVCLLSEIYFVSDTYMWVTFDSNAFCKAILFLVILVMMTSDSFLLAIAVQRYVMICRPHGKQMTLFWRKMTVALVISTNFILAFPTTVLAGVMDREVIYKGQNISGPSCFLGNKQYPDLQLIYYSITILIVVSNIIATAGMYMPIARVIYKHFHSKRTRRLNITVEEISCDSGTGDNVSGARSPERRSTPETNFNQMFFTIITVYVLSYLPTCVMLIITNLNESFLGNLGFQEFTIFNWLFRCYAINHSANPFIYTYFDLELRHNIAKLIPCRRWGYAVENKTSSKGQTSVEMLEF